MTYVTINPVQATCGHCSQFQDGLCYARARAEWENCYVDEDRESCFIFDPAEPDLAVLFDEFDRLVENRPYLSEDNDADIFNELDDEFDCEDYEYAEIE